MANVLDVIDAELQELRLAEERTHIDLKALRTNIRRLEKARNILIGEEKPKKKVTKGKASSVKEEHVADVGKYIEENFHEDQEFTVTDIVEKGYDKVSKSTVNSALNQLRADGRIHLVRVGGRTNTTRFYKVAMTNALVTESN